MRMKRVKQEDREDQKRFLCVSADAQRGWPAPGLQPPSLQNHLLIFMIFLFNSFDEGTWSTGTWGNRV
jgi:hypothetical protein